MLDFGQRISRYQISQDGALNGTKIGLIAITATHAVIPLVNIITIYFLTIYLEIGWWFLLYFEQLSGAKESLRSY